MTMRRDPRTGINTVQSIRGQSAREFAAHAAAAFGPWALPRGERPETVVDAEVATLDLAGGGGMILARWIVRCPWCSGSELADPNDPWFYCLSCLNERVGQAFVAVRFPVRKLEIERELVRRPKRENWAWLPGESLRDLRWQTAKLTDGLFWYAADWEIDTPPDADDLPGDRQGEGQPWR